MMIIMVNMRGLNSKKSTTLKEMTKDPFPKCPLFRGSTVINYKCVEC